MLGRGLAAKKAVGLVVSLVLREFEIMGKEKGGLRHYWLRENKLYQKLMGTESLDVIIYKKMT